MANLYCFDYVAAWLGWTVRDQYFDCNPVNTETATEPLTKVSTESDRQSWSVRERDEICAPTDQPVDEVLENADDRDRLQACRNRLLVYLFAYSGCRGT